jgi:hypothetical protein
MKHKGVITVASYAILLPVNTPSDQISFVGVGLDGLYKALPISSNP